MDGGLHRACRQSGGLRDLAGGLAVHDGEFHQAPMIGMDSREHRRCQIVIVSEGSRFVIAVIHGIMRERDGLRPTGLLAQAIDQAMPGDGGDEGAFRAA